MAVKEIILAVIYQLERYRQFGYCCLYLWKQMKGSKSEDAVQIMLLKLAME